MKNFISRNNLYLITILALLVAIFLLLNWSTISVLQRMVGLFFCAIVVHLWEEGRFPGGFTEMITEKLDFTQRDPYFGEVVTDAYVLWITFIPFFFPNVVWLAMAPMLLGLVEAIVHLAAIKIFKLPRFYSPGLVTAWVFLLPISIYTFAYAVQNNLLQPVYWLFSLLYMLPGLMLAQLIVVRKSGMKYSDFLKNVRANILGK